jgi:ASC-1-like (ASCH) protein
VVSDLPLLYVRKEVFCWLKQGKKTIDIRKGKPLRGENIVFQSGPNTLRAKIVKRESGLLDEILRSDNYMKVIPSAVRLCDALDYLQMIYGACDGVFTAYYLASSNYSEKTNFTSKSSQ